MKLIVAIVSSEDTTKVSRELIRAQFPITKFSTTGGFLMTGNTTFVVGVEDDMVQYVLDIIGKNSKTRSKMVPTSASYGMGMLASIPIEVPVGGATVFVLDVDQFIKL